MGDVNTEPIFTFSFPVANSFIIPNQIPNEEDNARPEQQWKMHLLTFQACAAKHAMATEFQSKHSVS